MRAVVQDRFGPPDVLELREIDEPEVGDGDVLVRVRAASVNPADWYLMTGRPWLARPQMGLRRPRTGRLGVDLAGEVAAVGGGRPGGALTALQGLRDKGGSSRATGCWSTAPRAGSAPSPSSSPRPLAPRSPPSAAPGTWRRSGPWAPTGSSTTPGRTSPAAAGVTTCCWTSPAAGRGRPAAGSWSRRGGWSWSAPPRGAACSARCVERTYPLLDAADALRHLGEGHARGKLVVTV